MKMKPWDKRVYVATGSYAWLVLMFLAFAWGQGNTNYMEEVIYVGLYGSMGWAAGVVLLKAAFYKNVGWVASVLSLVFLIGPFYLSAAYCAEVSGAC